MRLLLPSRDVVRAELIEHAHEALSYVIALSWTHVILPLLGGPSLVSIGELMRHKYQGPYLVFVWLYTALVTSLCWWWFHLADERAAAPSAASLFDRVVAAIWGYSSGSMAWVATYMWMCALLGTLPTENPIEAVCSAVLLTVVAATAVIYGQRGRGPLAKALQRPRGQRLKMVVFFTTWMTATAWVGVLTVCLDAIFGLSPFSAAWLVAAGVLVARWVWLLRCNHQGGAAAAAEVYPASLDAGLTVGLVASADPTRDDLATASLGLVALAGAWAATIALQAASSATWAVWAWRGGTVAATANVVYAALMSCACVGTVATARTSAAHRANVLAAETAALAVACGWAWYNALAGSFLPALSASSALVRSYGAVCTTVAGVLAMMALRPHSAPAPTSESAGGYRPPA